MNGYYGGRVNVSEAGGDCITVNVVTSDTIAKSASINITAEEARYLASRLNRMARRFERISIK